MQDSNAQLTAEDYAYNLPDHWVMDAQEPTNWFPVVHRTYVQRVVDLIRSTGARTVLEVGCGDGWNCDKLVKAGLQVTGIDWSRNGTSYAKLLVPAAEIYCGDIRDEEFKRRFPLPFDAAILVEVLEHIPPDDCTQALQNIAGTIRKNGHLILTTPSKTLRNDNPQHYRHFDVETLQALVEQTGVFKIESIEGYGDVPYQDRMTQRLRWFCNRYYIVKPIVRRILERYRSSYTTHRPLDRCAGFILKIRRV